MKVLLICGSPRGEGNTHIALSEVAKALQECGVETEIVGIGTKAVHDAEGLQVMRVLGRNMAWMLKNLKEGPTPIPDAEERVSTNFIR